MKKTAPRFGVLSTTLMRTTGIPNDLYKESKLELVLAFFKAQPTVQMLSDVGDSDSRSSVGSSGINREGFFYAPEIFGMMFRIKKSEFFSG